MTVKDLINLLHTFPPELTVIRSKWSEAVLLEPSDVGLAKACWPRPDGWVENARPDKAKQEYLLLN